MSYTINVSHYPIDEEPGAIVATVKIAAAGSEYRINRALSAETIDCLKQAVSDVCGLPVDSLACDTFAGVHYTVGTSYFRSLKDAYRYYKDYGTDRAAVNCKLKNGGIHIGKPPKLHELDELFLIKDEGRYAWKVQR